MDESTTSDTVLLSISCILQHITTCPTSLALMCAAYIDYIDCMHMPAGNVKIVPCIDTYLVPSFH